MKSFTRFFLRFFLYREVSKFWSCVILKITTVETNISENSFNREKKFLDRQTREKSFPSYVLAFA